MARFHPLCGLALACAATALPAQPLDAPPTEPTGIVSRAYGPTAGAVRWRRARDDEGAISGYEVRRDSRSLGVFDALGHVEHALEPGRTYLYTVTAIDGAGQRSRNAARVYLTMPDLPPPTPTGLRARIYSSTAAALIWDRANAFGTRYEVRRDGHVVALTDGVTHVDTDLDAGRVYRYEVVAFNRQGLSSAPARSTLWTAEDGPPALRAPPIERIDVYSATAAELFWERPPANGPVTGVEVRRDGERLGVTDGTSFFDDTRSPGFDHRYALVALDADGRRSDGRVGEGPIRPDNAATLIAAAFDVWRGEPWARTVRALPRFSLSPGFPLFEPWTFTCTNGGSATIFSSDPFIDTYGFEGCRDGQWLLDGRFGRDLRPGGFLHLFSEAGMSVTGPGGTVRFRGYVRDGRDVENGWNTDVDPVELVRSGGDGRVIYALRDAELRFNYGPIMRGSREIVALNGSFSLRSARTEGATLEVEGALWRELADPSGQRLPIPQDWTFTDGELRIVADDGSSLLLEADTGDERTARVTITTAAGERRVLERAWRVWRENLRFE